MLQSASPGLCDPAPASVAPVRAHAGDALTLSAPAAARLAASGAAASSYQVKIQVFLPGEATRGYPFDLGTIPVAQDGSFRATVRLPSALPAGEGIVLFNGSVADRCGAVGGSCAGYMARPSVQIVP